jgi:uncharacterized phage protein (TIGR02218 family)
VTNPIDLYRIVMGPLVWTLTASVDQVYNSETYTETAMSRNGIEQKNEISKASIEVKIPIDHELALNLLTSYSEEVMTITIFTKIDGDVETSWKGRLASIKPGEAEFAMNFESVFTSLRRPGLRARFQRSCRHALYGRGCTLDYNDFASVATISAIVGNTLTVPEALLQTDGYFIGGMVGAGDGALSYVINHVGDQLTLQRINYSILTEFALTGVGTAITLYPGCNRLRATCITKFNNLANYGGFDWIPEKNPMGGSSIV